MNTVQPATVGLTSIETIPPLAYESKETTVRKVRHLVGSDVMHQVNKEEFKHMSQRNKVEVKANRVNSYMGSSNMGSTLTGGNNVIGQVEPKGTFTSLLLI